MVILSMSEKKEYLKVGSYTPPDENGNREKIVREFFRQGMVFKSGEAFYDTEHPDRICYVPELSDSEYTRNDFLKMCNDQLEFAEELFDGVDWQHPETLMEDWFVNNEWVVCKGCGRLINYGDGSGDKNCPKCGWKVEVD